MMFKLILIYVYSQCCVNNLVDWSPYPRPAVNLRHLILVFLYLTVEEFSHVSSSVAHVVQQPRQIHLVRIKRRVAENKT